MAHVHFHILKWCLVTFQKHIQFFIWLKEEEEKKTAIRNLIQTFHHTGKCIIEIIVFDSHLVKYQGVHSAQHSDSFFRLISENNQGKKEKKTTDKTST